MFTVCFECPIKILIGTQGFGHSNGIIDTVVCVDGVYRYSRDEGMYANPVNRACPGVGVR